MERERCVVCSQATEYAFDTPVSDREFYIEGVGQLCPRCYYDLYEKERFTVEKTLRGGEERYLCVFKDYK